MKRIIALGVFSVALLGALRVEAGEGTTSGDRVAQLQAQLERANAAITALDARLSALEKNLSTLATSPVPTPPIPPCRRVCEPRTVPNGSTQDRPSRDPSPRDPSGAPWGG